MKAKILIALGIAACLCFGACSLQDPEVLHSKRSRSFPPPIPLYRWIMRYRNCPRIPWIP